MLREHATSFQPILSISTDIHDLCSALSHGDPLWTPGRRLELSTPPLQSQSSMQGLTVPNQHHYLDSSPPETAIEATPGEINLLLSFIPWILTITSAFKVDGNAPFKNRRHS